jgi:mannose/fructose/N-acetylgalactosamine-specific phosphotransferase system component IIC
MITAALLVTALLFGGMVLYSFGFAAFLFTALPPETAGLTIRRAFPHFYLFVIGTASLAALLTLALALPLSLALGAIAVSVLPTRQLLMPAINHATDSGSRSAFKWLHGLSVIITLSHIVVAGWVLSQIPGLAS